MADSVNLELGTLRVGKLVSGSTDDHMWGTVDIVLPQAPGPAVTFEASVKLAVGSTFDERHLEVSLPRIVGVDLDVQDAQRAIARNCAAVLTASTGGVRLEPAKLVDLSGRELSIRQVVSVKINRPTGGGW